MARPRSFGAGLPDSQNATPNERHLLELLQQLGREVRAQNEVIEALHATTTELAELAQKLTEATVEGAGDGG